MATATLAEPIERILLKAPATGTLAVDAAGEGGADSREATALTLTGERIPLGGGIALEVDLDGMDFSRFEEGGRVPFLFSHSYAKDDVLGVTLSYELGGEPGKRKTRRMWNGVRFNEENAWILSAIRAGEYPSGVSLGFAPMDYDIELDEESGDVVILVKTSVFHELSLAPVPAVGVAGFGVGGMDEWLDAAGVSAIIESKRAARLSAGKTEGITMATEVMDKTETQGAPPAPAPDAAAIYGIAEGLIGLNAKNPERAEMIRDAAAESVLLGESEGDYRKRLQSVLQGGQHSRKVEMQMGDRPRVFNPDRYMAALAWPNHPEFQDLGAFEIQFMGNREVPKARASGAHAIPMELFFGDADIPANAARRFELNATTATGGYQDAMPTQTRVPWIASLIARTPILGKVNLLSGLVDNQDLPRLTSNIEASWTGDGATISEATPNADRIQLFPRQLSVQYQLSNLLNLQSSGESERAVRMNAMNAMASGLEKGIIVGDGTAGDARLGVQGILNQPAGNIGTGINQLNTHQMNDAGNDEQNLRLSDVRGALSLLFEDYTPYTSDLTFLLDHKRFTAGMDTNIDTGSGRFLIEGLMPPPGGVGIVEGTIRPFNVFACLSRHITPTETSNKTDRGQVVGIAGQFKDVVVGIWGMMDVILDPYGAPGNLRTTLIAYADVELARASSFCRIII